MFNDSAGSLAVIVAVLIVAAFVFFLIRALVLWYFRLDEIVDLLKKQTELLETIAVERTSNALKVAAAENKDSPAPLPPVSQPSRPNPLTRK